MKKIFNIFAISATILSVYGCTKEAPSDQFITEDNVKVVQFSTTPVTKTIFGTPDGSSVPTLWTTNHNVSVSLNYGSKKETSNMVLGSGGTTATFSAAIADDSSGDYNFYAVSPAEAAVGFSSSYTSATIDIPTSQTPLDASVDELAQVLVAQQSAGSTFPTSLTMNFSHITAYGKLSFSNLSLADGETVASVSLTPASTSWVGRFYYYFANHDPYSAGSVVAGNASETLTLITTKTTDIWFACAPVDLGGETVDVVVTTNTGTTYSRTITIPAGKAFESGKISSFTVNMSTAVRSAAVNYTLVKNVSDLTIGSEIIIVYPTENVAAGVRGSSTFLPAQAVTIAENIVNTPSSAVEVFKIANGSIAGTYALKCSSEEDKYLTHNSGTSITTNASLTDAGSWAISIDNNGTASVRNMNDKTRYLLSNSKSGYRFTTYAPGSDYKDVSIYKNTSTGSGEITPKVPASIAVTGAKTNYNIGEDYSFNGTVTLYYSDLSSEVLTSDDYTINDSSVNTAEGGEYTIYVSLNTNGSINTSYNITVASFVTYTVNSTSTVSTSGTAPYGSSAAYTQTYGTAKQMTSGNSITLTLSGFGGKKITGATVSVKSNSSRGAGYLSLVTGSTTIASIADSNFNTSSWNGAWSTSYVNKELTVAETTIANDATIVLTITATANSLFFESLTLTYE